ncbi:hypothetical protein ACWDSJ_04120 [Nocardia sp. NPDC003482]|uniref:hypothetical protein n=1 Tax=Nocardia sp. NPDC004068 TaxID=3364303 RepID=UPI003681DA2F
MKKNSRIAARVAVAAALVALPLAAVAGPALADATPDATQIDGPWQPPFPPGPHPGGPHRGDGEHHHHHHHHGPDRPLPPTGSAG